MQPCLKITLLRCVVRDVMPTVILVRVMVTIILIGLWKLEMGVLIRLLTLILV